MLYKIPLILRTNLAVMAESEEEAVERVAESMKRTQEKLMDGQEQYIDFDGIENLDEDEMLEAMKRDLPNDDTHEDYILFTVGEDPEREGRCDA